MHSNADFPLHGSSPNIVVAELCLNFGADVTKWMKIVKRLRVLCNVHQKEVAGLCSLSTDMVSQRRVQALSISTDGM